MLRVFKYDFPVADLVSMNLPAGAQILRVDWQDGAPKLWALVDPTQPTTERLFRFAGTGHPIDPILKLKFINTFIFADGAQVYHIFEVVGFVGERPALHITHVN